MVIWASIDPTNFFVPTSFVPTIIGLAYATIIWGFAPVGLAANTARDVGGRMMAVAIWGSKANGGAYGAIAALTNILTASLSLIVYETLFADSSRGTRRLSKPFSCSQILTVPPSSRQLFLQIITSTCVLRRLNWSIATGIPPQKYQNNTTRAIRPKVRTA